MRNLWILVIAVSSAIALLFGIQASMQSWKCYRLKSLARVNIEQYSLIELNESKYAIGLKYFFTISGNRYEGYSELKKVLYLNHYAAEKALESIKKRQWTAWFDPKNPDYNAIQKLPPYKAAIRSFLAFALTFYFYGLKKFLEKQEAYSS